MPDKNKMNAEMKIRCYLEEKELLKKQADEVGMSMSDYVRSLIFGNEKVVLLSEGAEIEKAVYLIQTDLEYFLSNRGIPDESVRAITEALNDVSTLLNAVSKKLTDIHAECEEAGSDE